jgi:hypothetical protein
MTDQLDVLLAGAETRRAKTNFFEINLEGQVDEYLEYQIKQRQKRVDYFFNSTLMTDEEVKFIQLKINSKNLKEIDSAIEWMKEKQDSYLHPTAVLTLNDSQKWNHIKKLIQPYYLTEEFKREEQLFKCCNSLESSGLILNLLYIILVSRIDFRFNHLVLMWRLFRLPFVVNSLIVLRILK